jgi:hypothetical protein
MENGIKTIAYTDYYRQLITWDVITEDEYRKLSNPEKSTFIFYGNAPKGYFNQKRTIIK